MTAIEVPAEVHQEESRGGATGVVRGLLARRYAPGRSEGS